MAATNRTTRIVLALGIGLGLLDLVLFPMQNPQQVGLATDVYTRAAEAVLAGENIYLVEPPNLPGYRFVYPPVVALAFLPYGLVGDTTVAFAVQTGLNVLAALALARVVVALLEPTDVELDRLDHVLLAAFCLLSTNAVVTLVNGQLNLFLGLLIGAGLLAVERGRAPIGGAAMAVAASVKLFPAILGAYLLRLRAWRAVLTAVATGLGLLALGVLTLGIDRLEAFFSIALPSEMQTGALASDPGSVGYATVRRQLAWLLPDLDPGLLPILAAIVLLPVVAVHYRRVETRTERMLVALGTLVATLLWLPTEPIYGPIYFAPLLAALYLVRRPVPRALLVAGTLLTYVRITPGGADPYLAALPDGWPLVPLLRDVVPSILLVVIPPTIGLALVLAAGVAYQLGSTDGHRSSSDP